MSFLQLVLSLDKTIKEIILLWRICQFDRYRNNFPKFSAQIYIPLIFRIRRKLQTQAHFTSNVYVRQNGLHYQEDLEVVHVKLTQAIKGIFSISVKL